MALKLKLNSILSKFKKPSAQLREKVKTLKKAVVRTDTKWKEIIEKFQKELENGSDKFVIFDEQASEQYASVLLSFKETDKRLETVANSIKKSENFKEIRNSLLLALDYISNTKISNTKIKIGEDKNLKFDTENSLQYSIRMKNSYKKYLNLQVNLKSIFEKIISKTKTEGRKNLWRNACSYFENKFIISTTRVQSFQEQLLKSIANDKIATIETVDEILKIFLKNFSNDNNLKLKCEMACENLKNEISEAEKKQKETKQENYKDEHVGDINVKEFSQNLFPYEEKQMFMEDASFIEQLNQLYESKNKNIYDIFNSKISEYYRSIEKSGNEIHRIMIDYLNGFIKKPQSSDPRYFPKIDPKQESWELDIKSYEFAVARLWTDLTKLQDHIRSLSSDLRNHKLDSVGKNIETQCSKVDNLCKELTRKEYSLIYGIKEKSKQMKKTFKLVRESINKQQIDKLLKCKSLNEILIVLNLEHLLISKNRVEDLRDTLIPSIKKIINSGKADQKLLEECKINFEYMLKNDDIKSDFTNNLIKISGITETEILKNSLINKIKNSKTIEDIALNFKNSEMFSENYTFNRANVNLKGDVIEYLTYDTIKKHLSRDEDLSEIKEKLYLWIEKEDSELGSKFLDWLLSKKSEIENQINIEMHNDYTLNEGEGEEAKISETIKSNKKAIKNIKNSSSAKEIAEILKNYGKRYLNDSSFNEIYNFLVKDELQNLLNEKETLEFIKGGLSFISNNEEWYRRFGAEDFFKFIKRIESEVKEESIRIQKEQEKKKKLSKIGYTDPKIFGEIGNCKTSDDVAKVLESWDEPGAYADNKSTLLSYFDDRSGDLKKFINENNDYLSEIKENLKNFIAEPSQETFLNIYDLLDTKYEEIMEDILQKNLELEKEKLKNAKTKEQILSDIKNVKDISGVIQALIDWGKSIEANKIKLPKADKKKFDESEENFIITTNNLKNYNIIANEINNLELNKSNLKYVDYLAKLNQDVILLKDLTETLMREYDASRLKINSENMLLNIKEQQNILNSESIKISEDSILPKDENTSFVDKQVAQNNVTKFPASSQHKTVENIPRKRSTRTEYLKNLAEQKSKEEADFLKELGIEL